MKPNHKAISLRLILHSNKRNKNIDVVDVENKATTKKEQLLFRTITKRLKNKKKLMEILVGLVFCQQV